jgi:hypothetical protein
MLFYFLALSAAERERHAAFLPQLIYLLLSSAEQGLVRKIEKAVLNPECGQQRQRKDRSSSRFKRKPDAHQYSPQRRNRAVLAARQDVSRGGKTQHQTTKKHKPLRTGSESDGHAG